MNLDVFISYPHEDKTTADAACAALEADGIRCWIAPRDVAPGSEWAAAIIDAVDRCRVMVLIFSSSTNRSVQIHREVQRALDQGKPLVPLRVENVEPVQALAYYLGPVHWLDALTPPLAAHLENLGAAVKALLQAQTPGDRPGQDQQRPAPQTSIAASRKGFRRALLAAGGVSATAAAVTLGWFMLSARAPVTPATSAPSQAAAIEGAYNGTMECDKLPWTGATLHAAVALSIKGPNVTFSREVYSGDGKRSIGTESGTGLLDADGVVQLTTSWVSPTSRFDGRYIGRLSAAGGSLSGQQILLVDGKRHDRPCTIVVRKA